MAAPTPSLRPSLPPPAQPSRRWRMARTVVALVQREMATSYGRNPGGYLWAVLEPVAALAVLVTVFSMMMRSPPLGVSFPLFYATGYLPFTMFNSIANGTARALRFSRPLLTYPAVTFIDALLARLIVQVLTHLVVGVILLGVILILFDTHTILDPSAILAGTLLTAVLGFSIGLLNCYLMGAFSVWEMGWSILTRPLFIISGVIFIYEDLPRFARDILWWNPVMHVLGIFRTGFYPTYSAPWTSPIYVLVISALVALPGLLLLHRFSRDLLQR